MKAAKEWGYRIPEDMSIIGIDDIETCQYTTPMLTTIHIPMEDLGIMTAKILIDRIETGKRIPIESGTNRSVLSKEEAVRPRLLSRLPGKSS